MSADRPQPPRDPGRRRFIAGSATALAGLLAGRDAWAGLAREALPEFAPIGLAAAGTAAPGGREWPRWWVGTGPERWCWPTPNPAFIDRAPLEAMIQSTGPDKPIESGTFGCVRNGGYRFHEGIDLFPLERDRRGEALDPVFAAAAGRVVHVNAVSGNSSYGRYVVIEHDSISARPLTLYAHLRSVGPGIRPGRLVGAGEEIGGLGRSSSSPIPRERAHLHFEIAFRLSDDFESFYARQGHKEPNRQGHYNGQNLVGVDPLAFLERLRDGKARGLAAHLRTHASAFTLRVARRTPPPFLLRHPDLAVPSLPDRPVAGWDVEFTGYGMPVRWRPLMDCADPLLASEGAVTVVEVDSAQGGGQLACRRLLRGTAGAEQPGEPLLDILRLLLGIA